jgi:uncharacterized protein (TIGR03437 family)
MNPPRRFWILTGLLLSQVIALPQQARQARLTDDPSRPMPDYDSRLQPFAGSDMPAFTLESRVWTPKPGEQIRAASAGDARQAAEDFLASRGIPLAFLRTQTLENLEVVEFQGHWRGRPVLESSFKVAIRDAREVVAAVMGPAAPAHVEPEEPLITALDAARAAYQASGAEPPAELDSIDHPISGYAWLNPLGESRNPILADLVVFPLGSQRGRLAWKIHLEREGRHAYEMIIDAGDARLLRRLSLFRAAGLGKVFKASPDKGDRELASFPDSWLPPGQTQTMGNNADAYLDINGDNLPDQIPDAGIRGGRAFSQTQVFDFPAPVPGTPVDPRTLRAAAVTNAFYFANVAHDFFLGLGFNETAGNFQADNANRGGIGGDPMRVEVQDLFQFSNAGILVAPEGTSPRMELGIFTRGTSTQLDDRDFAYDGQTVMHEYSHGVTSRTLSGGRGAGCLSGHQSRSLDEGWADYFASSFFSDPVQSSYLSPNPRRGIRRQSYEGYSFTYEDMGNEGFLVHQDGEIWAATLWDIRKLLGPQITDRLVYSALALTPCRPTYADARDAILAADQALNNGANRSKLYPIFARHGLGASASGVDGGLEAITVFNAAYDLPNDLAPGNRAPLVNSAPSSVLAQGDLLNYQIRATDPDGGTLRYELVQGPTGMSVDATTGVVRWTAGLTSARAKIAITDGQGGRVIHGIFLLVITPLQSGKALPVSTQRDAVLTVVTVPEGTPVLQVTLRSGKGDGGLLVIDPFGFPTFDEGRIGQSETLSFPSPTPGRWLISLSPASPATFLESVQLAATLIDPQTIGGNARLEGRIGEATSETYYKVIVPPGASSLGITFTGGSGDGDLVVRRETPPACQVLGDFLSFRCLGTHGSFLFGNRESVTIGAPAAGTWYIDVVTSDGYHGAVLATRMEVRPTLVVDASTLTFNAVQGQPAPPAQSFTISNASGSDFQWSATASPNTPWLKLDSTAGTGNAVFKVNVDTQALPPGAYTGAITISAGGLGSSPQTVNVRLNVTARPVISASPAQLNFTSAPGQNPAVQRLSFTNTGGGTLEWTSSVATSAGGNWLSVDVSKGMGNNANLQVIVQAGALAPGIYNGTITLAATAAASVTISVRYTVVIPITVSEASLRSVASNRTGYPVAPGEMLAIQGSNFTGDCSMQPAAPNPCPASTGFPLSTELAGVRVQSNGINSPLLLVTPTEIRFLLPYEIQGAEVSIVVIRQGAAAPPVVRQLLPQSVAIFTLLENGAGAAKLYHNDGTIVSRAAPMLAGESLSLLAGGLGVLNPAVLTGAAGPTEIASVATPVRLYLDFQQVPVDAAYLEPGTAGIYRLEFKAPEMLASKFPSLIVEGSDLQSNEASAGGMSLFDVMPAQISRGADASITLRGINLPEGAAVQIGEQSFPAQLTDGPLQSLAVTLPATALEAAGQLQLRVVNPASPEDGASNAVTLTVR